MEHLTIEQEVKTGIAELEAALGFPTLHTFTTPFTTWWKIQYVSRVADQGSKRRIAVDVLAKFAKDKRVRIFSLITGYEAGVSRDGFPVIALEWRGSK
jgi:hypothetical protein